MKSKSISGDLKNKVVQFINEKIIGNKKIFLQYRPDRYSLNLENYKSGPNFFSDCDIEKWNQGNLVNAGDITRFYFINLCIDQLLEEGLVGNVAELGVYKGNSAFLLAKYARKINKTLYLFDTFEGFDTKDITGLDDKVKADSFTDTSLDSVKELVGNSNVEYVKGYFPDSLIQVGEIDRFSLVHIDCDLEKPFEASLEYFYPKLIKGGFLIMHDYSSLYWPGATRAMNDFFKDKTEFIIPIPDKSGTAVIRKV